MLMTVILILSLAGAVGYGFAASVGAAGLWKCALIFAGGVLGLSALFLLFALIVSFFISPESSLSSSARSGRGKSRTRSAAFSSRRAGT